MSHFDSARDYSVTDTAHILGVTPPTIYKLLGRGELQGYVVGARCRRITGQSIERLRSGASQQAKVGAA